MALEGEGAQGFVGDVGESLYFGEGAGVVGEEPAPGAAGGGLFLGVDAEMGLGAEEGGGVDVVGLRGLRDVGGEHGAVGEKGAEETRGGEERAVGGRGDEKLLTRDGGGEGEHVAEMERENGGENGGGGLQWDEETVGR